jgi:glc operon protein GlcG
MGEGSRAKATQQKAQNRKQAPVGEWLWAIHHSLFTIHHSQLPQPLVILDPLPNNVLMLTRNNIRLTLEGARAILAAAENKAREIKVPQNIAIVDEGGHLLVFARMDGAKLSSVEVALTKARAAALRRTPTGPAPSSAEPSVLLSLGLPLATGGKLTCIRGGLPLMVNGQCVGGIGVSAGTEEEDVQVAQAGVEALAKLA